MIDIFSAAGLKKPDISILDERFLAEVRGLKHKNVAAELLERLLKDEIKLRSKKNAVQGQLFSEKLKLTLNAYHNRAIATQEIIEELIRIGAEQSNEEAGEHFAPREVIKLMVNLLLWGNHYTRIEYDNSSRIIGFYPLAPWTVNPASMSPLMATATARFNSITGEGSARNRRS